MFERRWDPLEHFRSVQSDEQRARTQIMGRIRGTYFRHEKHDEIVEHVDDLIGQLTERRDSRLTGDLTTTHEAKGFAVIGEPRAGKSTVLKRIFREHPAFPNYGIVGSNCPLVSLIPQGACTLDRFTIDALRSLGMPVEAVPRQEQRLAHMVRDHMRLMGAKILHIDEAHHITQPADRKQIKKIINTFKCLLIDKEWPVALIFSGIPELTAALWADGQLRGRFSFIRLPALTIAKDARQIRYVIRALASVANLTITDEHRTAIAVRCIHAAGYQLGRSIEYIQEAIENALKRQPQILAATRAEAAVTGQLLPQDFGRAFRRRTAAEDEDNPFLAENWEATTPDLSVEERFVQDRLAAEPMRGDQRKKG